MWTVFGSRGDSEDTCTFPSRRWHKADVERARLAGAELPPGAAIGDDMEVGAVHGRRLHGDQRGIAILYRDGERLRLTPTYLLIGKDEPTTWCDLDSICYSAASARHHEPDTQTKCHGEQHEAKADLGEEGQSCDSWSAFHGGHARCLVRAFQLGPSGRGQGLKVVLCHRRTCLVAQRGA